MEERRDHRGERVVALGDRIKGMLAPLEGVCRYRERRGEDTASFEVTPKRKEALAFTLAAAPGGINLDCAAFAVKELAVEQADVAALMVEAILAGRVRVVRQIGRSGQPRAARAYVFDEGGALLFKHRRSGALAAFSRVVRTERQRFAAYA